MTRSLAVAISLSLLFAVNMALFDVYAPVWEVLIRTVAIVGSAFAAAIWWLQAAMEIIARRRGR